MTRIMGFDLSSGKDRTRFAIMCPAGKVQMVVDRDDLNALNAGRKGDRATIAKTLVAIVSRHGAEVEQRESQDRREITLRWSLNGVGALVHVCPVHGGNHALIHWHNTLYPSRDFAPAFCSAVGDHGRTRLHVKATSFPRDWYSLAMFLDAGLCLAFGNQAFVPAFDL